MSLWILQNNFAAIVNGHLFEVLGGAGFAQIAGNGRVTLTGSAGAVGGVIARLVNSPFPVAIRGEGPDFSTRPTAGFTLRDSGGETIYDRYPGTTAVEIVYDLSECDGRGQWTLDANQQRRAAPLYIVLYHELVHADELLRGVVPPDVEAGAIVAENQLRRRDGLVERVGPVGGCGAAQSPKAPKPAPPPTKGKGCFIASAAFGSDLDPSVVSLREFRDRILRPTRSGAAFWDEYFEIYRAVSEPVVAAMTTDERVRHLVRWSLVTPIVHYLEIARDFPDDDLSSAPEPWRSFLLRTAQLLEEFAAAVPRPTSFADMTIDDAIAEISLFCRYAYRSPQARRRWLRSLVGDGILPLPVAAEDRPRHVAMLAQTGRTHDEIAVIVAPADTEGLRLTYRREDELGQRDPAATGTWFYTVNVRNLSTDTFDSIDLFYKRRNLPGVVYLTEPNVSPGRIAPFVLGPCDQVESYVVAFIIGGDLVASLPAEGNMTPELASVISPSDKEPCADSWSIE